MLKRLVVAMVGLVGVVIVALGVASATLWRADDVLVADLRADEHVVVTDPGVLELAASEVTVRVEADGPVVLAIGRDTDVTGWVGEDAHQRVTGLSGWHTLAAEDVAAPAPTAEATAPPEGEAAAGDGTSGEGSVEGDAPVDGETGGEAAEGEAPADGDAAAAGETAVDDVPAVPDPTGSDLWIAEATGDGDAEITWTAQPGRWSVLAVSTGDAPPRVSLAWPQVVTTPWLWPCVVIGSLLVLAAAALLLRDLLRRRRGAEADWTPVLSGPVPVVGADGAPVQLTRRQLRELAAHGAVADVGIRVPRDHDASAPAAEPAPVGTSRAVPGARPGAPGPFDPVGPGTVEPPVPTPVGRATGALAGVAPATRRALRAVTSFGSSAPRDDEQAAAHEPAVPVGSGQPASSQHAAAAAAPGVDGRAGATGAGRAGAGGTGWTPTGAGPRPATPGSTAPGPAPQPTWRPVPGAAPGTAAPGGFPGTAAPGTAAPGRAAPSSVPGTATPSAPAPPAAARWSGGGVGPAPWTTPSSAPERAGAASDVPVAPGRSTAPEHAAVRGRRAASTGPAPDPAAPGPGGGAPGTWSAGPDRTTGRPGSGEAYPAGRPAWLGRQATDPTVAGAAPQAPGGPVTSHTASPAAGASAGHPSAGHPSAASRSAGHPPAGPSHAGPAVPAWSAPAASAAPPPGRSSGSSAPWSPAASHPAASEVRPGARSSGPEAGPPAAATRAARHGRATVPPVPGAVAGPSSGPDAPRPDAPRPDAPRPDVLRPGTPAPPTGGAGAHGGPAGWRPTPSAAPHPDASYPDTPRPDSRHVDAPRPAWLRDAPAPGGPRAGGAVPADQPGSRADAWRRAWGLAATDDDPTSEEGR